MALELCMTIGFLVSVGLLFYTFVGYPLVMILLSRGRGATKSEETNELPTVTVIVVMGNEAENARQKVEDVYANGYPPDRLDMIVVLDAPSDATPSILESIARSQMTVLKFDEHRGKAACLNDGVSKATGEILLFCDTRQKLSKGAIASLATRFFDPSVGAVSGELIIDGGDMGAYWRFEKALRKAESSWGTVIGCTGALYAIRRELFQPVPDDTILDDVVIPMHCLAQGYAVLFEPDAVALDPQPASMAFETRRKVRTLAGNWQMLFRYPGWLLPWKNRAFVQLVSHKYLRLAGPWLLILAFVSNLMLSSPVPRVCLGVQAALYLVAGAGLAFPNLRLAAVRLPATFVYLNWLNAAAFPAWVLGWYRDGWGAQTTAAQEEPRA